MKSPNLRKERARRLRTALRNTRNNCKDLPVFSAAATTRKLIPASSASLLPRCSSRRRNKSSYNQNQNKSIIRQSQKCLFNRKSKLLLINNKNGLFLLKRTKARLRTSLKLERVVSPKKRQKRNKDLRKQTENLYWIRLTSTPSNWLT